MEVEVAGSEDTLRGAGLQECTRFSKLWSNFPGAGLGKIYQCHAETPSILLMGMQDRARAGSVTRTVMCCVTTDGGQHIVLHRP